MKQKDSIVVAGDFVTDILRYPREAECGDTVPAWKQIPGMSETSQNGGASLVADIVKAACPQSNVLSACTSDSCSKGTRLISRLSLQKFETKKGTCWRATSLDGYDKVGDDSCNACSAPDVETCDTLVLFDSGNGYGDTKALWPKVVTSPSFSGNVLMRICDPGNNSLLRREIQTLRKKQDVLVTIVIDAADLRASGLSISRGLSWERTMVDFSTEMLRHSIGMSLLEDSDYLVVRFGYEGAIVVESKGALDNIARNKRLIAGSLIFNNQYGEGDLDRSFNGKMVGVTSTFIAGLTRAGVDKADKDSWLECLKQGVASGLATGETLLQELGFGSTEKTPAYPVQAVGELIITNQNSTGYSEAELIELTDDNPCTQEHGVSILKNQIPDTLTNLGRKIVKTGDLSCLTNVPLGQFGKCTTVERSEIENYRKIRNLMTEYLTVPASERPLCFAVFGPPGSGKSFGVKQLAKVISKSGDHKIKPITLNLSEFQTPDELTKSLQLVRDITLEGETPLVFFDEFDSGKGGQELFWLKYFLAPMQDGEFRDGEHNHPIGKSIFVFAGGTKKSFHEFSNRNGDDFKNAKGPDFVSRLRGFLNVMGPNPVSDEDYGCIIRRALLLRNFLEGRAKKMGSRKHEMQDSNGNILIDDGLLTAFLKVPKYRHGVRSIQAVIEMSSLTMGRGYRKSEVPSKDQLDMHVDAEAFITLMYRDEQFETYARQIGPMIHAAYLKDLDDAKALIQDKPTHQPWDKLTEETKESNYDQARDIPEKLSYFGIEIKNSPDESEEIVEDFDKEVLHFLSVCEHNRWMSTEAASHPCMVHWNNLPQAEKDKDSNTVKRIPEYLKSVGLLMVKKK